MSISLTEHDVRAITFNFHALHYDCLQPKLGLNSVYALIVPPGETISSDHMDQLFLLGGYDPIVGTASSEKLTRIAADKVDLLMFGYSGSPSDLSDWMAQPDLSIGVVLSNMIKVELFGRGEDEANFSLAPAMLTTTAGPDMLFGIVRIDDETFAEITPANFEEIIGATSPNLNISR